MLYPTIKSRQNQRVKDAAKLRDRRQRDKQGRILIDGAREIGRAVAANVPMVELFFCAELLDSDACPSDPEGSNSRTRSFRVAGAGTARGLYGPTEDAQSLVEQIAAMGAEVAEVSPDVFSKLAFGDRLEGMVAVAMTPSTHLDAIELPPSPLVAVLDRVEKPGNIGAVARSADGAGVAGLILADGRTDLFNPNAIRASLGTLFSIRAAESTAEDSRRWLREKHLPIFVARPQASRLYTEIDFTAGGAIVLGSEADGASETWHGEGMTPIRLPMLGTADSLNVSATAAVVFYEAMRQRGQWRNSDCGLRIAD